MYLEQLESLSKDTLLSEELIEEIEEIQSSFEKQMVLIQVEERAKKLKCVNAFKKLYKGYLKDIEAVSVREKEAAKTEFSMLNGDPQGQLYCGDWVANDKGIYIHTQNGKGLACYHPIFPTKVLRNAETGQYKIELKFSVRGKERSCLVDKSTIATPTKIIKLADYSVQVNSLTAPFLVSYLSDIESLNPQITEWTSTSRLGWIEETNENGEKVKMFMPYDKDVIFDNEANTKSLFDSIREEGDREFWYSLIKDIRAKRQPEVLINLAASYASVLVEPCGALPFIVSLWGGTGIGKTVVLMIATSVWADPSEGAYMTDAKATTTAMEIRLNVSNSLPMTLDDMAQIKNQSDEDFSQLIYRWCAGKGRDRSNVNLGLNKLTSWRNCTITNGERSLVDESTQGGAVNRVIDIEASGEALFDGQSGNKTANALRRNFGFSGKDFITLLKQMPQNELMSLVDKYFNLIKEDAAKDGLEKEDKQIMPMALILTADELIEKYLFQDGVRLDLHTCVQYLKNKGEVNEHKRAYEYLVGSISINRFHFAARDFSDWDENVQCWGFWLDDDFTQIAIEPLIVDKILKEGGFQSRAFKSWAKKNNLLDCDVEHCTKNIRTSNGVKKYICLAIRDLDAPEGFESATSDTPFI